MTRRLYLKGVSAAVPEQATLRHDVRRALRSLRRGLFRAGRGLTERGLLRQIDVLGFPVIRADAEVRLPLQISQRGDGTRARQRQRETAEHDWSVIRRSIGTIRAVTRGAGHFAGRRQARIIKYFPAKLCHGRKRSDGRTDEMNWIWVFAWQTLRLGREDGAGRKAGAEKPHECATVHDYISDGRDRGRDRGRGGGRDRRRGSQTPRRPYLPPGRGSAWVRRPLCHDRSRTCP